ncbi:MAG: type II secretion system major pseudopilin GspG [Candidatus Omnitrophica bacterium]|nr:type II secretion system major pseudopilin GspG [Candidatus Omnitrophota bacterium]
MKNKNAFTLIELMLVVIIIGVLAAMVMPRLAGRSEQAKEAAAKADIEANMAIALDLYELDNGQYPTTEQGLAALARKPTSAPIPDNWKKPYLKKEPLDPWGRPYIYKCPGEYNTEEYDLASWGKDGLEGGGDDVVNWQ